MKHKFINKKASAEARVIAMYLDSDGVMQVDGYDTVEDLMDDYAAYEKYEPPKEPLIKDEKIRKAVRAWAEVNGAKELKYIVDENSLQDIFRNSISFNRVLDLKDGYTYTITELCGEEEG